MNAEIKTISNIYDLSGIPCKTRICPECGKRFKFTGTEYWTYKISNGNGDYKYYCSYSCMKKNKTVKLTCKRCGKEFTVEKDRHRGRYPNYCSSECRDIVMNERTTERHRIQREKQKRKRLEERKKHIEEMRNKLK